MLNCKLGLAYQEYVEKVGKADNKENILFVWASELLCRMLRQAGQAVCRRLPAEAPVGCDLAALNYICVVNTIISLLSFSLHMYTARTM